MLEARPWLVTCVLNWNRPDDTIACVASLMAGSAVDQHVLVVDNGSSDDSVVRLRARFGDAVEIVETGANRFFAGGMNAGIERALAIGAELILLLNNDTTVAPDAVSRLLGAAADYANAGILAPAIHYATDRRRIWSLGSRCSRWWPFPREIGRNAVDRGRYRAPLRVDFVTGCAMLIRREVIERIGLFDEGYRHYFEDADFCARARAAGFGLLVEPRARIYHAVAQSAAREAVTVRYLKTRNRARFYRTHRFGPASFLTHLALGGQESVRALGQAVRGNRSLASAIWRGLIDGYRESLATRPGDVGHPPVLATVGLATMSDLALTPTTPPSSAIPEMEHTPCPLCGSDVPRPVHELADWLLDAGGAYRLVRCTACGLLYLNPRPTRDAMSRHYPSDYAPFQRADPGTIPWWRRPWRGYGLAKRRRAVTRLVPGGRLLDVGCASGEFLAAMRAMGSWDVVGLERAPTAASCARERYGIEVRNADVDVAAFDDGAFDVITLWDVLEHLPSPCQTLRRLRPWLKDAGWLVIRVPDAGSLWARAFGRYWAGFDAPRHLVTFDRRTLTRLLAESGYVIKAEWALSGTHAMAVLSVNVWLRATGRRRGWGRMLGNPIAQALTAPFFWLTDRFGGALLTVAAQPYHNGR